MGSSNIVVSLPLNRDPDFLGKRDENSVVNVSDRFFPTKIPGNSAAEAAQEGTNRRTFRPKEASYKRPTSTGRLSTSPSTCPATCLTKERTNFVFCPEDLNSRLGGTYKKECFPPVFVDSYRLAKSSCFRGKLIRCPFDAKYFRTPAIVVPVPSLLP